MLEQCGDPLLLSFLCCLPHPIPPLGHALPALCRVHVRLNDVLPRLCPSLPSLHRKSTFLVRLVHRYYGTVRLLQHVQARWRSPGSRACCFSACAGSQTTQDRQSTRDIAWLPCCLPPSRKGVGILIHRLFEAQ